MDSLKEPESNQEGEAMKKKKPIHIDLRGSDKTQINWKKIEDLTPITEENYMEACIDLWYILSKNEYTFDEEIGIQDFKIILLGQLGYQPCENGCPLCEHHGTCHQCEVGKELTPKFCDTTGQPYSTWSYSFLKHKISDPKLAKKFLIQLKDILGLNDIYEINIKKYGKEGWKEPIEKCIRPVFIRKFKAIREKHSGEFGSFYTSFKINGGSKKNSKTGFTIALNFKGPFENIDKIIKF